MKDNKARQQVTLGALVKSNCGRDMGTHYLVWGFAQDKDHILCCDGKMRKQAKPKKKRIKHVNVLTVIEPLQQKLYGNQKVFDSEIFSAIKSVLDETV